MSELSQKKSDAVFTLYNAVSSGQMASRYIRGLEAYNPLYRHIADRLDASLKEIDFLANLANHIEK